MQQLNLFSNKIPKKEVKEDEQKIFDLIKRRRLQMLIHSCIYYRLNENVISDYTFDKWARELVELQNKYPEIAAKVPYHEYFIDWDGSTGFHLPLHEEWIINKAMNILEISKRRQDK